MECHAEELTQFLANQSTKISFLCIQETHLKQSSSFSIEGYSMAFNCRTNQRGGGTAIFVSNSIPFRIIESSIIDIEYTEIETILEVSQSPLRIISIYLPPNKFIDDSKLLALLSARNIIVIGDLNAKHPLWGSAFPDSRGKIISSCLLDHSDLICINTGEPTHLDRKGNMSHLDLSFCSANLAKLADWLVLDENMGSDHYATLTSIGKTVSILPSIKPSWNFSKADWDGFSSCIGDFLNCSSLSAINLNLLSEFTNQILVAASSFIPLKGTSSKTRRLSYWSDECTAAIASRKIAGKRMKKCGSFENIFNFQKMKARTQFVIKQAKKIFWRSYVSNLSSNSTVGSVWDTIKILSGRCSKTNFSLKVNGCFIMSNMEKANIFAEEFGHVSSNSNLPIHYEETRKLTALRFINSINDSAMDIPDLGSQALNLPFKIDELNIALSQANRHSAPGSDNISMLMLLHLPPEGKLILLEIFNDCWNKGTLPTNWNHALIKPILKPNNDRSLPSSYRPIALTSAFSKILEKMVAARLTWYIETYNIISPIQAGFRKHHSTLDHAVRLKTEIENSLSVGGITVAVFLDFSRAFDLVWIDGLLLKLMRYNIGGNCLKFLRAFLINRSAEVVVDGVNSTKFFPENGTPQGCVLSPILFSLFINDFPKLSTFTSSALFADDSSIWRSGNNINIISHHLQADLKIIESWCKEWGFVVNVKKCMGVIFSRKKNLETSLILNGVQLQFSKSFNFLGFWFDCHLTWSQHINYIVQRSKSRINLLKCISHNEWGADRNTLLLVYRALIRSLLDYGCMLYKSASKHLLKKLDAVQCTSLSLVAGAMKGTALSSLLHDCDELPLNLRRDMLSAKYLAKILSCPGHIAHEITRIASMKQLSTNFPCRWGTEINLIHALCKSSLISGECTSLNPPWTLLGINTDTNIAKLFSPMQLRSSSASNKITKYISEMYPSATLVGPIR